MQRPMTGRQCIGRKGCSQPLAHMLTKVLTPKVLPKVLPKALTKALTIPHRLPVRRSWAGTPPPMQLVQRAPPAGHSAAPPPPPSPAACIGQLPLATWLANRHVERTRLHGRPPWRVPPRYMHCALYAVHCAVYAVHCALCIRGRHVAPWIQLLTACQPVLPPGGMLPEAPAVLTDLLANLQNTLTLTAEGEDVDRSPTASNDVSGDKPDGMGVDSGHVVAVQGGKAVVPAHKPPGPQVPLKAAEFPEHLYPAGRILWIMPDVTNHPADESSVQVLYIVFVDLAVICLCFITFV